MEISKDIEDLKQLWPFIRPFRRDFLFVLACIAFVALLRLPLPLLMKYLIDNAIPSGRLSAVDLVGLAIMAVYMLSYSGKFLKGYVLARFVQKAMFKLEIRLYRHTLSLPLRYFRDNKSGYIVSRLTGDLRHVETLLSQRVLGLALDVFTFAFGAVVMFVLDPRLALLSILLLPAYSLSTLFFSKRVEACSKTTLEASAQMLGNLQESIVGILTAKAYGSEEYETCRHADRWRAFAKERVRLAWLLSFSTSSMALIGGLGPLVAYWYGGRQVIQGAVSLGTLVAFGGLLGYVFGPTQRAISLAITSKDGLAGLQRILDVLREKPEEEGTASRHGGRRLRHLEVRGRVCFENVRFGYESKPELLRGVNLEAVPGTISAIVGRNGAGKTTLLMLLLRLLDPVTGRIFLDGVDIRGLDLAWYRSQIAPVLQESFLFDGTLAENIAYGARHATREKVIRAARMASAHSFIEELREGYDMQIRERGSVLSDGQKQRLALARALFKEPKVLVLDEPTAFLDSESERLIQESLKRLKERMTIIVVAHKPSTLTMADRIYVLDQGKITAEGRHDWLERNVAAYRYLFKESTPSEPGPVCAA